MKEGWFLELEGGRHIPGHSEVGVLVNSTRNEAGDVLPLAEDEGEAGAETGRGLDGREHDFPDVGGVIEPEDSLHLIESHVTHHLEHVLVKSSTDMFEILENESLVDVEAQSDDVFGIVDGQLFGLVHFEALPQILLVVGQLNDQGDVEGLLKPLH